MNRLAAMAVLLSALLAVGGCGSSSGSSKPPPVVDIALDFTPNAVHAPIYAAVRAGLDRRNHIRLRIRQPGAGPDALKLVASGRVLLGVQDIGDLAIARRRGIPVVGVAALVDRPLAALIAQPSITRPRDLDGRTIGVSGLPSDPPFVKAIMAHDGGDASTTHQVTIGFAAVSALLTRRVAAVPAFWNAEGVALAHKGHPMHEFRIDDYGAPPYPEVVLITSTASLHDHRDRVLAAVRAIAAGVTEVRAHPAAAVAEIATAADVSDRGLVRAQLDAVAPLFATGLKLDRAVLDRWSAFEKRIGLIDRPTDVARSFDFTVAG